MIEPFISGDRTRAQPVQKHVEPWSTSVDIGFRSGWTYLNDANGYMLGAIIQSHVAEQIVSAVNAISGIPSGALQPGAMQSVLDAIDDIFAAGETDGDTFTCADEDVARLQVAVLRLKGEKS